METQKHGMAIFTTTILIAIPSHLKKSYKISAFEKVKDAFTKNERCLTEVLP